MVEASALSLAADTPRTAMQPEQSTADTVRWLCGMGWKLFPTFPDKNPATEAGFYNSSDNPDRVMAMLAKAPNGGLAVETGRRLGAFVLDCDNEEAYQAVIAKGVPTTVTAKTRRGYHFYFDCPRGRDLVVRNRTDLLNKTDIRGDAGYVRIPPFHGLAWINPPGTTAFAPAPAWLIDLLKAPKHSAPGNGATLPANRTVDRVDLSRPRGNADRRVAAYCLAALDDEARQLASLSEGARNAGLNTAALKLGHLAHHGAFTEARAMAALQSACDANGLLADDGFAAFEATFHSGWGAGIAEPRDIPANGGGQTEVSGTNDTNAIAPAAEGNRADGSGQATDPPKRRFELIPFDEIVPTLEARYLIKGLISHEALIVAWGPPKCGKSFWVFDAAMHIACGFAYRGLRVRQGPVVYIAAEGAAGFKARVEAWRAKHLPENYEPILFYLLPMRVNLTTDHLAFIADVTAQIRDLIPSLIVVDTLNRTIDGSESSDEDMGDYVKAADAIKEAFRCAVAIVHHCGIEGSRPRGHTSLTGAADTQIAIRRDGTGLITAKVEWMKDGPEGYETSSRLETVEIGFDEDGDPVTTCVIIPSDDTPSKAGGRKLSPQVLAIFDGLQDALGHEGTVPQVNNHIPSGVATVSPETWRRYCYAKDPEAEADAKRQAFGRGSKKLIAMGMVRTWENHSWIVDGQHQQPP